MPYRLVSFFLQTFYLGVVMRSILVGWEFVLVVLGDAAEWLRGSRVFAAVWPWVAVALVFACVAAVVGTVERF